MKGMHSNSMLTGRALLQNTVSGIAVDGVLLGQVCLVTFLFFQSWAHKTTANVTHRNISPVLEGRLGEKFIQAKEKEGGNRRRHQGSHTTDGEVEGCRTSPRWECVGWLWGREGRTEACCYGYSQTAYTSLAGAQESQHAPCPPQGLHQPQSCTEGTQCHAVMSKFTQLILKLFAK